MLPEPLRAVGEAVAKHLGRAAGRVQEETPLATDLYAGDDEYLAVVDAPGVRASDVQVRFVDDRIDVRVERFREFHEGYEMRYPGRGLSLEGSVTLPEDDAVDPDAADAGLQSDGTLQVRLPRTD